MGIMAQLERASKQVVGMKEGGIGVVQRKVTPALSLACLVRSS